jgi:hypothetical protein
MQSLRTFLLTALAAFALAACGGGLGTLPPSDPSGSSVEKATLWVGYDILMNAFPVTGNGLVTPEATLGTFWSLGTDVPGIVDVAIASDGTRWVLENRSFALGGPGWHLYSVAAGESGPMNTYGDNVNEPIALALGADGVLVAYSDANGTTTIATYPYGASNAPAIRTLQISGPVFGFAVGHLGYLYVARPNRVDIYSPTSTGCCPVRSIATFMLPRNLWTGARYFKVGPDNSIYLVDLPGNQANPVMYVNVYSGDGTLARRIGPLPANYHGLAWPVITVDAKNRLYVATNDGQIYQFGPSANGTDAPQRLMIDPTIGRPAAMAFGPPL